MMQGAEMAGRPSLGVKSTHLRLPEGLAERIDALVGKRRRADFIRQVVVHEVDRLERFKQRRSDMALGPDGRPEKRE
jgi:hypothetical protein